MACNNCHIVFDNEDQKPLVLKTCGHTLCSQCVAMLLQARREKTKCPFCEALCFPANIELLNVSSESESHCQICIECFDDEAHRPLVAACGHSLCSHCVAQLLGKDKQNIKCPFCNSTYFPANSALLRTLGIDDQEDLSFLL